MTTELKEVEQTKEQRAVSPTQHVRCPRCFPIGMYGNGSRIRSLCGLWMTCVNPRPCHRITPRICAMCVEIKVCPACGYVIPWPGA
jgi:hypothetical protein